MAVLGLLVAVDGLGVDVPKSSPLSFLCPGLGPRMALLARLVGVDVDLRCACRKTSWRGTPMAVLGLRVPVGVLGAEEPWSPPLLCLCPGVGLPMALLARLVGGDVDLTTPWRGAPMAVLGLRVSVDVPEAEVPRWSPLLCLCPGLGPLMAGLALLAADDGSRRLAMTIACPVMGPNMALLAVHVGVEGVVVDAAEEGPVL